MKIIAPLINVNPLLTFHAGSLPRGSTIQFGCFEGRRSFRLQILPRRRRQRTGAAAERIIQKGSSPKTRIISQCMISLIQLIHTPRLRQLAGIQGGLFRWLGEKIVRSKLFRTYMPAGYRVAEGPNHVVCLKDLNLLIVRCLIPVNIG
jgi:hypothetical protein